MRRVDATLSAGLRRIAFLAILIALLAAGARAASDEPPIPDPLVRLRVESANFSPSKHALDIVLLAEIAEGWHVNAHHPTSDAMVPTVLTVTPPNGFQVGEIVYPDPEQRTLRFAGGQAIDVYGGSVRFHIPLEIKDTLTQDGASFAAKLHYQACDETRCLRPADVERAFVVKRPADIETSRAPSPASTNTTPIEEWLTRYGLGPTLLIVFFMGVGLNLTPCVYPLISVTVAYFGGQAREQRGQTIALATVYALGIAVTFSLLGLAAALSGGLFGRALQQPATLIGIAAVMVILALSNFGLYTLQPPPWVMQKLGRAGQGFAGALFMGLTMGVVAAPCVGPVIVGLLVAVGARGDAVLGFGLFFALALGLGSPYVALGASASSIARLPRAGEWLVWVEHVFGFLLLGLALYFVGPLLPPRARDYAAIALLVAAALTLGILDRHGDTMRTFRLFKWTVSAAAVLLAVWFALPRTALTTMIAWQAFSPDALEKARAAGKPAVVDFRADWCLPCVEMEKTTFVAEEVGKRSKDFVMLRADVTEMTKASEELLSRYGVLGVPTTLFFSTNGIEQHRMVGYVSKEDFSRLLDETRSARGDAVAGATAAPKT